MPSCRTFMMMFTQFLINYVWRENTQHILLSDFPNIMEIQYIVSLYLTSSAHPLCSSRNPARTENRKLYNNFAAPYLPPGHSKDPSVGIIYFPLTCKTTEIVASAWGKSLVWLWFRWSILPSGGGRERRTFSLLIVLDENSSTKNLGR